MSGTVDDLVRKESKGNQLNQSQRVIPYFIVDVCYIHYKENVVTKIIRQDATNDIKSNVTSKQR